MAPDRGFVATGDRAGERLGAALGPVGGRVQDQGREQLARVGDPRGLEQLDRRLLQRDQELEAMHAAAW